MPRTIYPAKRASTVCVPSAVPAWCPIVTPRCGCHVLGLCGLSSRGAVLQTSPNDCAVQHEKYPGDHLVP